MRKLLFAFTIISVFTLSIYSCEDIETSLDAIQENVNVEDEVGLDTKNSNREFEVAKAKLIESVQSQKRDMSTIFRSLQKLNSGLSDLSDNEKKLRLDTLTQDADSVLLEMNAMEGYIDDINLPAQEKQEAKNEGGIVTFIPYVIILILLIILCVQFFKNSKSNKKKEELLYKKLDQQKEIESLKKKQHELQKELEYAERKRKELEQAVSKKNEVVYRQPEESCSPTFVAASPVERKASSHRAIFVGVPSNGIFVEEYGNYRPRKTLYKLFTTSEDAATFEFYDDIEAVETAKISRTSILEVACDVENGEQTTFSSIQTIESGLVRKTNDGWAIVRKAHVRLM